MVIHEFIRNTIAMESLASSCGLDYRYAGTCTRRTGRDTWKSVPLVEQSFAVAPPGIHKEADLDRMRG